MKVLNVHEREFSAEPERVGALMDSLASSNDGLWPGHPWPAMRFDRPLAVGARGGHGPIRYVVEEHDPSASIRFRFTGPSGFNGFHGYDLVSIPDRPTTLRHTVKMTTQGLAILSWPLIFEPLHDALIEDSFARAEESLGLPPKVLPWSPRAKILRWLVSGGKAPSQGTLIRRDKS